jgi:hypothetical protein
MTWFAGCLLVLVLLPCAASAAGVELAVGVWNQTPKGDVAYKGTTAQDNLNIKNDLKYGDETRLSGRIRIETPLFFPNIYLMASPMRFKESGSKTTPFNFGNVLIAATSPSPRS